MRGDLTNITDSYQDVLGQNHFAPMNIDMNTLAASAAELKNMMNGLISQEEYIKRCDELKKNETTEAYTGEYLFTAKEDFTEEQTVTVFCGCTPELCRHTDWHDYSGDK